MSSNNLIKKIFESQIDVKVNSIHPFEITNNCVYRVETKFKPYIFKIFNYNYWPENGKLLFINQKLNENNIPAAKIFVFSRDNEDFPNGYLIEECLPGTTADKLALSVDENITLFEKIAVLTSKVHQIKITNYGHINSGIAEWTSFSEYMHDGLNYYAINLVKNNLIDASDFEIIKEELKQRLKPCDKIPPVLCHYDIRPKNVLVNLSDITFIDWDEARSLCWMADVAFFTLWAKIEYGDDLANIYRKAFLDKYETEYDKAIFYELEDILHVRHCLDFLTFFAGKPQYENTKMILKKLINKYKFQGIKCL